MDLGDADEDRSNVEDRRVIPPAAKAGAGVTVGVIVVVVLFTLFSKSDPSGIVKQATGTRTAQRGQPKLSGAARAAAEKKVEKVAVGSFNDAQRVWTELLAQSPKKYRNAKLVLFWDQTQSACGTAGAAVGPFYCSGDNKAYIDLGFYRELAQRYGAPGEFAQAYVIAHEIGHHVQNVLGTTLKVRNDGARRPAMKNALSVKMELQADCYAGVWGYAAAKRGKINSTDIEKGLQAAAALGDDTLRRQAGKAIAPETFTHGASADREKWFRRGLERGTLAACDTFR